MLLRLETAAFSFVGDFKKHLQWLIVDYQQSSSGQRNREGEEKKRGPELCI